MRRGCAWLVVRRRMHRQHALQHELQPEHIRHGRMALPVLGHETAHVAVHIVLRVAAARKERCIGKVVRDRLAVQLHAGQRVVDDGRVHARAVRGVRTPQRR